MSVRAAHWGPRRRGALIAHDDRQRDLRDWVRSNRDDLAGHELLATGPAASALAGEFALAVARFRRDPLGDERAPTSGTAARPVDFLIFFWDPRQPNPADPDVRALLRLAVVWDVPIACTRASADLMLSSHRAGDVHARRLPPMDERRWYPELAVALA